MTAEIGYEWLFVDTEHGHIDFDRLFSILLAAKGTPLDVIVRLPCLRESAIKRPSIWAPAGWWCLMVQNADQVAAAVRWSKYAPQGLRGYGPLRADHYTLRADLYREDANAVTTVIAQIESLEAVECIREIVNVPGLDGVFMGIDDLSQSMGILGEPEHPDLIANVNRVFDAAQGGGRGLRDLRAAGGTVPALDRAGGAPHDHRLGYGVLGGRIERGMDPVEVRGQGLKDRSGSGRLACCAAGCPPRAGLLYCGNWPSRSAGAALAGRIRNMNKVYCWTKWWLLAVLMVGCGGTAPPAPSEQTEEVGVGQYLAYFGTYTRFEDGGQGIYAYRFDPSTGQMTEIGLAAELADPAFVAIHPNHRYLYAVTEVSGDGGVSAFGIDRATGMLELLNRVSSQGSGPCHLNVDATGRMLALANYGSGRTVSFPVQQDGRLGEAASVIQHHGSSINPDRQKRPHAHSVNFSPDNRFVITADLGTDELYVYRIDPAAGTIEPHDPPSAKVHPGGGPRHFTFHPSGKFCYAINEMGNTVTAFRWTAESGAMQEIQMISTLPKDYSGTDNSTAEVLVHPSGKFLYGSNRGHDSIAVFSIDPTSGKLSAVDHTSTQGKTPRNFNLDPTGRYLFAENENTHTVVGFAIDPETGRLTPTGQVLSIPRPVCLRWVPLG